MKNRLNIIWGAYKLLKITVIVGCLACFFNSCGREVPIKLPEKEIVDPSMEDDNKPDDMMIQNLIHQIFRVDEIYKPIEFKEWIVMIIVDGHLRDPSSLDILLYLGEEFGDDPNASCTETLRVDIINLLRNAETFRYK